MKRWVIIVGALLVAGAVYGKKQYDLVEGTEFTYKRPKLVNFSLNSAQIGVDLEIANKTAYTASVKRVYTKVYANGVYLTTVTGDRPFDIVPYGSVSTPLVITFNPREVLSSIGVIAGQSSLNNVMFKFKGYVTVVKLGIPFRVPYTTELTWKEMMSE